MDNWDIYYKNTNNYIKPNNLLLKVNLNLIKKKEAIDFGCGTGRDTIYLLNNGFKVTAIDKNEKVIKLIQSKINDKENLKFIIGDFTKIDFDEVDLFNAQFCLSFLNNDNFEKVFSKIEKVIRKNGIFIGNVFGNNDEWIKYDNMTFLTKMQFINLFKNFDIDFFEEIEENKMTASGKIKHWHYYNIIAKKR